MRELLEQKAMLTDRVVLAFIVAVNSAALAKMQLCPDTLIGAFNGCMAAALLAASIWRPQQYSKWRAFPIALLRLAVCTLPLISDTVGPFEREPPVDAAWPWQLGRACFMLLVGVSWAVGLFSSAFLLLPPAHHLALSSVCLAMLFGNNRAVCQRFLAQHPSNAAIVDALDMGLQAAVVSTAPGVQWQMGSLGQQASKLTSCIAGATALQVSLGLVLPTLLAWQLQSRMAASIAAHAEAAQDSAMLRRVQNSQHFLLCAPITQVTQGCLLKLFATGGSMLISYLVAMLLLTWPPSSPGE